MRNKIVTVIGGTGFVGRYVVKYLAKEGYSIRVITRNPDAALGLKTSGEVGQIVLVPGNIARPESLKGKLDHSWAVINLVGILFESGPQNFAALHAQGPEKLAKMAAEAGAERFIHMSALGVDKATRSKYARTKAAGEKAVTAAFPGATLIRPSVIFGPEDQFFNRFARMAMIAPALPLIGGGETKFQPVYVGDVARAITQCLKDKQTEKQIYELGGTQISTFEALMEYLLEVLELDRWLVPIPFALAEFMAFFAEILPLPPLTRDQVRLLAYDNILSKNHPGFTELGIIPSAVEMIVPYYLEKYRKEQYEELESSAN